MSAGSGRDSERFAAAVDHGLDDVDPGDEQLFRELDVVAMLRESRASTGPSADASARMRARVMAAAATMVSADGISDEETTLPGLATPAGPAPVATLSAVSGTPVTALSDTTVFDGPIDDTSAHEDHTDGDLTEARQGNVVGIGTARGRHRSASTAVSAGPRRRGLLGMSAAAGLMVLALTGGGALYSQAALPGDSLYGVKQTTESGLVALTPGQGNKAQRQLDNAATRIDEVRQLSSEPADGGRAADISEALQGFDDQTENGSRMWLTSAASRDSANPAELGALSNWAQHQSGELSAMRDSLPASSQGDADHSLQVLEDIRTRAQSLSNRQGCAQVVSAETDELGPLPAKGACAGKDSSTLPASRTVVSPGGSTSSSRDRSGSSSSSSSDSDSETSRPSSTRDNGPTLPVLPDVVGGSHSTGSDGESDRDGDTTPEQTRKPVLNLPLVGPLGG